VVLAHLTTPPLGIFRAVRIATLLVVLGAVARWAAAIEVRREERRQWNRSLEVAVVVLSRSDIVGTEALRSGLDELAARLDAERRRWRGDGPAPFRLQVLGPTRWEGAFPVAPASPGLLDRARHWLELTRVTDEVHARLRLDPDAWDIRVYLLLEPGNPAGAETFVEGAGAHLGDLAMVRGRPGSDISLLLAAVGHEILHCVGAVDKYDDWGHTIEPDGLAEPDLHPAHPQRYAEWMAGEVPLGPGRGRLPASLAELRIGPATAREIGWMGGPRPAPIE
jgi:hypothetical protein